MCGLLADGSSLLEQIEVEAGPALWGGLGHRLLWFTKFWLEAPAIRGSQLLQSEYAAHAIRERHALAGPGAASDASPRAGAASMLDALRKAEEPLGPAPWTGQIERVHRGREDPALVLDLAAHALITLPPPDAEMEQEHKARHDSLLDGVEEVVERDLSATVTRFRAMSVAKGQLANSEDWRSYRTRTMSWKGRQSSADDGGEDE